MVCCIMSCLDNFGQTEFWLNLEGAGSMMDVFRDVSPARITTSSIFHDTIEVNYKYEAWSTMDST